ncbi:MAG: hypothetical protein J6X02_05895 [Bacilli bacterium]|nr:hypothetical protein [Bacilli bacterium]
MNNLQKNALRQAEFINKVYNAAISGEPFRIICIDIDNTIVNEKPIKDRLIMGIAKQQFDEVNRRIEESKNSSNTDDSRLAQAAYFDLVDRVLEEVDPEFMGKINYDEIYQTSNFFPRSIDYIRELLNTRRNNDFVILVSHYNVDREYVTKINTMLEVFPNIDGIFLPKFHLLQYGMPNRQTTSKIEFMKNILDVPSFYPRIMEVCPDLMSHLYLIDDSQSVLKDAVLHGANIIPFLPGYDPTKLGKTNLFDGAISSAGCLKDLQRRSVEEAIQYHKEHPLAYDGTRIISK